MVFIIVVSLECFEASEPLNIKISGTDLVHHQRLHDLISKALIVVVAVLIVINFIGNILILWEIVFLVIDTGKWHWQLFLGKLSSLISLV